MKRLLALVIVAALATSFAFAADNEHKADSKPAKKEKSHVTDAKSNNPADPLPKIKMHKAESGLEWQDEKVGTGASPTQGKTVVVHYTGWLTNGKKFDSSVDRNEPFEFQIGIGQVIKGWDEGVMSMKVGGKRKLFIPSNLAYGDRDVGGGLIPAGSKLVFDVELINIK